MKIHLKNAANINDGKFIEIDPTKCPYCHELQNPNMYCYLQYKTAHHIIIFCQCINNRCKKPFNRLYNIIDCKFTDIIQANYQKKQFSIDITSLSPLFECIYNEAYSAEQLELTQIMGMGYRKALEFLIKDYLISLYPEKEAEIKSKLLGKCINEDIEDPRIKEIAKRAVWLGNDETHYVRKWENKDVSHLKTLIDLCLHWIEAEISTKKMLEEMP